MSDPDFLTVADVLILHRDQLDLFGGQDGVRDEGALESAVMMAQQGAFGQFHHEDLFQMAAAYAYHIAESQAFVDGNKRTALSSAIQFLGMNGREVLDPKDKLYEAMIAIATHDLDKQGLGKLFESLSSPVE